MKSAIVVEADGRLSDWDRDDELFHYWNRFGTGYLSRCGIMAPDDELEWHEEGGAECVVCFEAR